MSATSIDQGSRSLPILLADEVAAVLAHGVDSPVSDDRPLSRHWAAARQQEVDEVLTRYHAAVRADDQGHAATLLDALRDLHDQTVADADDVGVFLVADGEAGVTYVGTVVDLVDAGAYSGRVMWVCGGCLIMAANHDDTGRESDEPVPLSLIPDEWHLVADGTPGGFRGSDCPGCGALAGDRYALIVDDEDDER